jgi:hypothetical protein
MNSSSKRSDSDVLEALKAGYLLALQMPFNKLRAENQATLAKMRDAIALATGSDAETVQNTFEEDARRILLDETAVTFMKAMGEP